MWWSLLAALAVTTRENWYKPAAVIALVCIIFRLRQICRRNGSPQPIPWALPQELPLPMSSSTTSKKPFMSGLPHLEVGTVHTSRSTVIGSTAELRFAGINAVTVPTARSRRATAAKVSISEADTPYRKRLTRRPAAKAQRKWAYGSASPLSYSTRKRDTVLIIDLKWAN